MVPGAIVGERCYNGTPGYTEYTVTFNSGSHTALDVFAGFWGMGAAASIQVGDVPVEQQ